MREFLQETRGQLVRWIIHLRREPFSMAFNLINPVILLIFLGAALTISSSAILMTMLRESGQLLHARGRLIVGILVVEDFAAVILLTVLTGVATTGTASPGDIGLLAAKLAIFGAVALVFGALFAPRLIHFVNRFRSDET